jgi:hypothetical protein
MVWCWIRAEQYRAGSLCHYYVLYGIVSHSDLLLLIYFYNNLFPYLALVCTVTRHYVERKMGRSFEVDGRPVSQPSCASFEVTLALGWFWF